MLRTETNKTTNILIYCTECGLFGEYPQDFTSKGEEWQCKACGKRFMKKPRRGMKLNTKIAQEIKFDLRENYNENSYD